MASLPLPSDRLQPADTLQRTQDNNNHPNELSLPQTSYDQRLSQYIDVNGNADQYIAGHTASSTSSSGVQQRQHLSSQHLLAAPMSHYMQTAGPASEAASETGSEALSEAAASADDTPIQPRNKQTAVGSRISPSIGRRTTPFSSSEPDHQSVASSQQAASPQAAEAGSIDTTRMHDPHTESEPAVTMLGSQQAASPMDSQHSDPMLDSQQAAAAAPDQQSVPMTDSQQGATMQTVQQGPNGSLAGAYLGSCAASQERPGGMGWRSYLTCCVRLSVEKEPHRCAAVCAVTWHAALSVTWVLPEVESSSELLGLW